MSHLAVKHGLTPKQVQAKMDAAGIKVGDSMVYAAQALNLFREKRSGGNVRPEAKGSKGHTGHARTHAAADAAKVLHDFDQGRKLGEVGEPEEQTREQKLRSIRRGMSLSLYGASNKRVFDPQEAAYVMHRHYNATRQLGSSFRSLERTAQNAYRDRRRATTTKGQKGRAGIDLHKKPPGVVTLAGGLLAGLESSRGSITRRFGPAIAAMESAHERHNAMILGVVERRERRQLAFEGRRMAEKPAVASKLYAHIDQKTDHRRHMHAELPKEHALSWVHDLVGGATGWRDLLTEARRLAAVEKERSAMRISHGHARRLHTIESGYDRLDRHEYRPSVLGDFFRRLVARKQTGADPGWWKPAWWSRTDGGRRRMAEVLQEEDEDERSRGPGRRLATAFLSGTVAAPFAFVDTVLPSGIIVPETDTTFWDAALRYVVYGTIGCYLTKPSFEASDIQGESSAEGEKNKGVDGTPLGVLRPSAEKMCFPAIPFVIPRTNTWRVVTNTVGVRYRDVSYAKYCSDDGASQHVARQLESFGINATDDSVPGKATVLRVGEAVDAVNSGIHSAQAEIPLESAGYLVCSIVQLGGVLYTTLLVVGVLVLLALFPIFNCCGRLLFDLLTFAGASVAETAQVAATAQADDVKTVTQPDQLEVVPPSRLQNFLRKRSTVGPIDNQRAAASAGRSRRARVAPTMGFLAGIIDMLNAPMTTDASSEEKRGLIASEV